MSKYRGKQQIVIVDVPGSKGPFESSKSLSLVITASFHHQTSTLYFVAEGQSSELYLGYPNASSKANKL